MSGKRRRKRRRKKRRRTRKKHQSLLDMMTIPTEPEDFLVLEEKNYWRESKGRYFPSKTNLPLMFF